MTFADGEHNNFVTGPQPRQTDLISIDALILLACVRCRGKSEDKARVFHRVVSPEMAQSIPVTDGDLRTALFFLITTATILEEMVRDMMKNPAMGMNYKVYQDKIKRYAPTYEGMISEFQDVIFGEYANRTNCETFVKTLAQNGWKYFDRKNLNQLFAITLEKYGTTNVMDGELPQFEPDHDYDHDHGHSNLDNHIKDSYGEKRQSERIVSAISERHDSGIILGSEAIPDEVYVATDGDSVVAAKKTYDF